jgi:hypothetical protein
LDRLKLAQRAVSVESAAPAGSAAPAELVEPGGLAGTVQMALSAQVKPPAAFAMRESESR